MKKKILIGALCILALVSGMGTSYVVRTNQKAEAFSKVVKRITTEKTKIDVNKLTPEEQAEYKTLISDIEQLKKEKDVNKITKKEKELKLFIDKVNARLKADGDKIYNEKTAQLATFVVPEGANDAERGIVDATKLEIETMIKNRADIAAIDAKIAELQTHIDNINKRIEDDRYTEPAPQNESDYTDYSDGDTSNDTSNETPPEQPSETPEDQNPLVTEE